MSATPSNAGFLLSFEGSEGCGKSTQIQLLRERLGSRGREVVLLREPGGTALGERIRHLLQHADEGNGITAEAELLLFAASRAQIVREKIKPMLGAGCFVILDRFLDSTTVYQGHARGLPLESVAAINAFAIDGTVPHLTIVLDMDTQTAWQRIRATGRELDRMESQPPAFFEVVRRGYLALAAAHPQRIAVIDAARNADDIHKEIWQLLTARHHAL